MQLPLLLKQLRAQLFDGAAGLRGVAVQAAVEHQEDVADEEQLAAVQRPAVPHAHQAAGARVGIAQLSKLLQ